MEKWIVTAVDYGDTCDGKARILQVCNDEESARAFVRADMEFWADERAGENISVDFDGMSATYDYSDEGCEWNVEKVVF